MNHRTHSRLHTCALLVSLSFGGCICGEPLIVDDVFVPPDPHVAPGTLHTYASNASVTFEVRSTSPFLDVADVDVAFGGALTADLENERTASGDLLKVNALTGDAGEGTLTFTRDGEPLSDRTVTVDDVEAIAIAVTAPEEPGIELPDVDVDRVRIFAGGKAAFRTTFTKGDEEIFGLKALTVTTSDAGVTTRNAVGCAAASCELPRCAVEIAVPETAATDVEVTLASGTASVVMTVVPTTVDDITSIVADPRDTTNLEEDDQTAVVAHVLAGDEPVFGAPVSWAIEDVAVTNDDDEPETGDVLQLDFSLNDHVTVDAAIGDRSFGIDLEDSNGEEPSVTSITSACGATGTAPVAALALACMMLARRRRSLP